MADPPPRPTPGTPPAEAQPLMARPSGAWKLSLSLWAKVLSFALAGGIVLALLPRAHSGTEPPVNLLLGAGLGLTLLAAAALFLALRFDLRVGTKVLACALGYNAIVLMIKFVLAPQGLYEVNRTTDITSWVNVTDPVGAAVTGLSVLLIYAGVYTGIYRLTRRRLQAQMAAREKKPGRTRRILIPLIVGTVLLAALGGIWVLFLPLIVVGSGSEYLQFVFTSSLSALIGVAIVASAGLAAVAFGNVAEQQGATRDAALLATFFWVGLYFLALYHVLWVVYILFLTSIWPLKVVTPK